MKYVSIDIETTGLDPRESCILSFGAVIEDTNNPLPLEELPKFHVYIKHDEPIEGTYYALQMNYKILEAIATGDTDITKPTDIPIIRKHELEAYFFMFLVSHGFEPNDKDRVTVSVAGKNFAGFDEKFIRKVIIGEKVRFRKRVLDPASLFVDFIDDDILPDLKTCKERAGVKGEVSHDALQDALDVIAVLRTKY